VGEKILKSGQHVTKIETKV